jgi:electron-transferring-flavoprotein dehydrogenase
MKPADFPPPFDPAEAVAEPSAPPDERIDVGFLVVGGGPAGLAAAIRLGQLLAEHPERAEELGDVPIAIVEKGKTAGSHLLSGAVVKPGPLERLLPGKELPFEGEVARESVYFLTRGNAVRIPTPPTMRNHGNRVVSLARLAKALAREAEEAGAMLLPETAATELLVEDGTVVGVRTGDKGRGRDGQPLAAFEPGSELRAQVTILAEGTQGHLTGAALDRFALRSDEPQVWALGVKEVWKVRRPLDRVIHTLGWPLRLGPRWREFGGSFAYPLGEEHVALGMVVGLDYRDVGLSVHDLLQELKTHPLFRELLDGGERVAWGAKTIPEGGWYALPKRLHAPGLLLAGDGVGLVNVPALKGIHYAVESGILAAEAAFSGDLAGYDSAIRSGWVGDDLRRVRTMRQAFGRGFFLGGALATLATATGGRFPRGPLRSEPDADQELLRSDRAARYPKPDGSLTFDKLSSVYASGNRTRDDQPSHLRLASPVPRDLAELWVAMCPAAVYTLGPEKDGLVEVEVAPSNCVQCGAITAKGGRLTPPEGGSGPEYTLT